MPSRRDAEMVHDVTFTLLTRQDITGRDAAAGILQTIIEAHRDLAPLRFGNTEPLKKTWTRGADLTPLLDGWENPFLWKNGSRAEGMASFWPGGSEHHAVALWCQPARIPPAVLRDLCTTLSERLQAEFAYVYPSYETMEMYLRRYKAVYPMNTGLGTVHLKRSIPELAWFTIFGPPYVELFGTEKLLTAPAHRVEPLPYGAVQMQLTNDPPAPNADSSGYDSVRDRVKEHLGREHFLDLADPAARRRAPPFEWSPDRREP